MDDFKLKQAGTPGMTNPPTVTPPPPAPVRAAAEIANQKNPVVLPSVDSVVLGASQGLDRGMRNFGSAVADTASSVAGQTANSASAARTSPPSNGVYTSESGSNPFAPLVDGVEATVKAGQAENQRIQAIDNTPTQPAGTVGGYVSNLWNKGVNAGLDAGVLSPDIVQRREVTTPAQQHAGAPTPTAPAPAAARPTQGEPYVGNEADIINKAVAGSQPAAQTPLPNMAYFDRMEREAPAYVGGAGRTQVGTRGGKPIYADEIAAPAPAAGAPAPGTDPLAREKAYLRERALSNQIDTINNAQDMTTQSKMLTIAKLMGVDQAERFTPMGEDTKRRGQDLQHDVGMGNVNANLYHTNTQAQTAAAGRSHDLTKLGMMNANEIEQLGARSTAAKSLAETQSKLELQKPMKMQTPTGEIMIVRDANGNMQGVMPTMVKGAKGKMEYDLTAFGAPPPQKDDKKK